MESKDADTVVDFTIEALRDAIRAGRLVPGQRLIVGDITRMLSVSAGPVREAIRRLTGEGLVEIVPHRGASVREISREDVKEIFQLREAVEGLAGRLAAEHVASPAYIAELDAIMTEMDAIYAHEDVEGFLDNNRRFHDLIYRMAENDRLRSLAAQLILPLYQLRLPHRMHRSEMDSSHSDHHKIAAAIRAGEGDRAEQAMRAHIARSREGLLEVVSNAMSPRVPRTRTG